MAILGENRDPDFPDALTFEELGYDSLLLRKPVWSGLFGPANLPPAIVDAVLKAVHRAMDEPSIIEFAQSAKSTLARQTSDQFRTELQAEYDAVRKLVRAAGIKATDLK